MLTLLLTFRLLTCPSTFVDEIDDGTARVISADGTVSTVDAASLPVGAREGSYFDCHGITPAPISRSITRLPGADISL